MQPTIIHYWSETDRTQVPIASATEISKGDFISYESNKAVLLDAAAEDITFVGLAETESDDGDTEDLVVLLRCIAEVDVVSADYSVGAGLKYSAKNKLVADGGANTIAWSLERKTSATRLKVLFDSPVLAKLFKSYA